MKLTYHWNSDYLLPDLGLSEAEQRPLGKYGRMHVRYLKDHRPGLYTRLLITAVGRRNIRNSWNICRKSTVPVRSGWNI